MSPEASPSAVEIYPVWPDGYEGCWTWDQKAATKNANLLIWRTVGDRQVVYRKGYSRSATGAEFRQKLKTIWKEARFHTEKGNSEIEALGLKFDNPKPLELVREVLSTFSQTGLTVLDSFAGSGTTAHAALAENANAGADWKFLIVEGEAYASDVTAERARRAIKGWSKSTIDDFREPLGGTFTYCTLGDPIDMDGLLTGADLPALQPLAALLYHTATAQAFEPGQLVPAPEIGPGVHRLGHANGRHLWLFYKPDLDYLKSAEAALTLSNARAIAATAEGEHLVFAPAKFVSRDLLSAQRIPVEYAPLPYSLYRVETA